MALDSRRTYEEFAFRVDRIKRDVVDFVRREAAAGKRIFVYGASTKGNTLLQYFGLDHTLLGAAAVDVVEGKERLLLLAAAGAAGAVGRQHLGADAPSVRGVLLVALGARPVIGPGAVHRAIVTAQNDCSTGRTCRTISGAVPLRTDKVRRDRAGTTKREVQC